MNIKHFVSASAAVALLAGIAMTAPGAAEAATCKPRISAKAVGNFQFSTRITARNRWKAAARDKYGRAFGTWARASNKDERCDKSGPGAKWLCRAVARPCN